MSDDQNRNCPPGSIPGLPDPGPGGEEQITEVEFPELNFPEFLSPIEEVDTSPFEGNSSIREINIIDEFLFLRSQVNLFTTNAEGEEVIEIPGFHDQADSNIFKRGRIPSSFKELVGTQVTDREVPRDTIRIENNYFWHLRGTEQAPVEEEWAKHNLNDSLVNPKYTWQRVIPIGGTDTPASAFHKTNTNRYRVRFLSEENRAAMDENFVAHKGVQMTTFEDFNTSVQQPLLASEATVQGIREEILSNSYVVDFEPVIGERTVDLDSFLIPESRMPGYYREYYRMVTENSEDCGIDDKIQKYICANLEDLDAANQSPTLLARNPNHIKITLKRPSSAGNEEGESRLDQILNIFAETQIDKYYLETLTGYGDYYRRKRFVQITDEKSPTQQQTARVNDRFTLNYLKVAKKRFERLISDISSDQEHQENVINKRQEYPLRFAAYSSLDDLMPREEIKVPEFENAWRTTNLNNPLRNYSNMLAGQKAPSFIVGYRIEKYVANSQSPVQVFYIMDRPRDKNSPDVPPIEFLDSQVRYGKTYRYRIYSLVIVYGTEYSYTNFTGHGDASDDETMVQVDDNHMLRLMEVPFIERTVALTDLPPLPPEVSFVPYQGVSNKIRLIMNHAIGDKREQPIRMMAGDSTTISAMASAQPSTEDGSIRYYSDTVPQEYQIFWTTSIPRSYSSFSYDTSITTNGDISVIKEMDVQPNLDYYFTFRSAESAGISNPSLVFKLRMVDTPNGVFMVLREYDIYSGRESYTNLEFQRALQISPALIQKSIVYPEGTDLSSRDFALTAPSLEDISLGYPNNSIWGKRYKFRLTSKTSGKKLDLNIRFEQNELNNFLVPEFTPGECDPILREQTNQQEESLGCIESLPMLPTAVLSFGARSERFSHKGPQCEETISLRKENTNVDNIRMEINWNEPREGMSFIDWLRAIPQVMKYCQCDENPNQLIDFIPPSVYADFERVEKFIEEKGRSSGNDVTDFDFTPIFGGDPAFRPKPQRTGFDQAGVNSLRENQRQWWYNPDTLEQYNQLAQIFEEAQDPESLQPWKRRLLRTSWFPHLETAPEEGTALDPGDPGGFKFEEKQYKCLQAIKAAMGTFSTAGIKDRARKSFGSYTAMRTKPVAEGVGIEFGELSQFDSRTNIFEIPKAHWPKGVLTVLQADDRRDSDSNFNQESQSCAEGFVWNGTECACPQGFVRSQDNPCECIPQEGNTPTHTCEGMQIDMTDPKSGESETLKIEGISNGTDACTYDLDVVVEYTLQCPEGQELQAGSEAKGKIRVTFSKTYADNSLTGEARKNDFLEDYDTYSAAVRSAVTRALSNFQDADESEIVMDLKTGEEINITQRLKNHFNTKVTCASNTNENLDDKCGPGETFKDGECVPINDGTGTGKEGGTGNKDSDTIAQRRFIRITPFLEMPVGTPNTAEIDRSTTEGADNSAIDIMFCFPFTSELDDHVMFTSGQWLTNVHDLGFLLFCNNEELERPNKGLWMNTTAFRDLLQRCTQTYQTFRQNHSDHGRGVVAPNFWSQGMNGFHGQASGVEQKVWKPSHRVNFGSDSTALANALGDQQHAFISNRFLNFADWVFYPLKYWLPFGNSVTNTITNIIDTTPNLTKNDNSRIYGLCVQYFTNETDASSATSPSNRNTPQCVATRFYTSSKVGILRAFTNASESTSREAKVYITTGRSSETSGGVNVNNFIFYSPDQTGFPSYKFFPDPGKIEVFTGDLTNTVNPVRHITDFFNAPTGGGRDHFED